MAAKKDTFEEKLEKLESLSENIRKTDISVDEAMKNFEEGIKLAKSIEKELDANAKASEHVMPAIDDLLFENNLKIADAKSGHFCYSHLTNFV